MTSFADRIAFSISTRNRAKKFEQFLSLVSPKPDETILDVGVNIEEYSEGDNYLERHYTHPENITAIGFGDVAPFRRRYPTVKTVSADGRSLPFADQSFDIAYSNAVIEHVGSRDDQLRFLRELVRIGTRGYLTTPNRFFPVEIHTRIPLLHLLLPKHVFDAVLRLIGKEWATGGYMNILSHSDIRKLFAKTDAKDVHIMRNRFCGFTITYTVTWTA